MFLGADLAAAYFIVHRKGAVKFVDDEEWHKMNARGRYKLPNAPAPGLHLEAIDASGTELMFEGLTLVVSSNNNKINFKDSTICMI